MLKAVVLASLLWRRCTVSRIACVFVSEAVQRVDDDGKLRVPAVAILSISKHVVTVFLRDWLDDCS